MENTNNPQPHDLSNSNQGNMSTPLKNLPNGVAVLVLGICSIFPGCFCYGIVGIVCGIIALVLAKKDMLLYNANPTQYNPASFSNLKAGRICGIIGICLSSLYIIFIVIYVIILGAAFSMVPWSSMTH